MFLPLYCYVNGLYCYVNYNNNNYSQNNNDGNNENFIDNKANYMIVIIMMMMMILLLLLSFYFYNYFTREPNSPEGALLTVSLENDVDKHKKRHLNLMQNALLYNVYHR